MKYRTNRMMTAFVAAFAAACVAYAAKPADAVERLLNSRASGSRRAYMAAAEEVAAAAKSGAPLQRYVLAIVSRDEDAPPAAKLDPSTREKWISESRELFRKVGDRTDNPLVWYLLAIDRADTNLLRVAAEKGNVQALNAWGNLQLDFGVNAVNTNEAARCRNRAVSLFRKAAGMGDANGLYNLGMCYARGLGEKRDDTSAFLCFRSAAEKGHPAAMNSFGWFLREGRIGAPDPEFAVKWFEKASDLGEPTATFNLALAHLRGEGVPKDETKAMAFMKEAAESGSPEAMDAWGVALMRGDGVEMDKAAAVRWFRKSATEGYPPAMENLVQCYDNGWGVPADAALALKWKMRSRAARGDAAAATWLKQNNFD